MKGNNGKLNKLLDKYDISCFNEEMYEKLNNLVEEYKND